MMMLALLTATLALTTQDAPARAVLMPYAETVRCAGLAQAASERAGNDDAEGRRFYDMALYWSLTAGQTGQASGKDAAEVDADQSQARATAAAQLAAEAPDARADLDRCRARTPSLG